MYISDVLSTLWTRNIYIEEKCLTTVIKEKITTGEIVNIRLGNETKPDTGTPFGLPGQTKWDYITHHKKF